jgi:hypothetical protein
LAEYRRIIVRYLVGQLAPQMSAIDGVDGSSAFWRSSWLLKCRLLMLWTAPLPFGALK